MQPPTPIYYIDNPWLVKLGISPIHGPLNSIITPGDYVFIANYGEGMIAAYVFRGNVEDYIVSWFVNYKIDEYIRDIAWILHGQCCTVYDNTHLGLACIDKQYDKKIIVEITDTIVVPQVLVH